MAPRDAAPSTGRVAVADFERALQTDPAIEALLADDPDLPRNTYFRSSVFLFLLEQIFRIREASCLRGAHSLTG